MPTKDVGRASEFFTDKQLERAMDFSDVGLQMVCPVCGTTGECRALRMPAADDVVICFDCGTPIVVVAIIGSLLMLRKAEAADLDQLGAETAQQIRQNAEAISFLNGIGGGVTGPDLSASDDINRGIAAAALERDQVGAHKVPEPNQAGPGGCCPTSDIDVTMPTDVETVEPQSNPEGLTKPSEPPASESGVKPSTKARSRRGGYDGT